MSVQQIKRMFVELIEEHQPIDPYELRRIFTEAIREWEMENGWDESNRGDPWTDDQIRAVLSDAPTKENCLKHARAFGRGYGAVEQVYRWATRTDPEIRAAGREDDVFIRQIKKVAKQVGWRA
jgi:hypothetical protein